MSGAAAVAPDYTTRCATCGVEVCRHFDGWDGSPLGCAETSRRWGGHYVAPAEAPAEAPAPTWREYAFNVTVTVREPVDEDDVDGYVKAEVEALVKRLLSSYNTRREAALYGGDVAVDWELMETRPVPAPRVDPRR